MATVPSVPVALPRRALRLGLRQRLGALAAAAVVLYLAFAGNHPWPAGWDAHAQSALDGLNRWVVENNNTSPIFVYGFNYAGQFLNGLVDGIYNGLHALTWVGLVVAASFGVFGVLGLWDLSLATLALILASVLIALAIGIPLGILAGRSDRFDQAITPVLDAMQIMPAFAYLMPVVLFFGIGAAAATVCTVIFAFPPAVRITSLGIRGVSPTVVEAGESLGVTRWQKLVKIQLPLAKRTIMLGVNQTIMLALSMVIVASVIAAGGLGDPVLKGLTVVKVGDALVPGVAIVVMAIALDRLTMAASVRAERRGRAQRVALSDERIRRLTVVGAVAAVALVVAARLLGVGGFPSGVSFSFAGPVNSWVASLQSSLNLQAVSNVFVRGVLDPLLHVLRASPWWLVIGVAAALAWILASWRTAATVTAALVAIGLLGVWDDSLDTLSQVIAAALVTVVIGVAIGILTSRSDTLEKVVRPVLDAMQTMPAFVYLIPVIGLFGIGRTPAAIAAVIYALPLVIRLTDSGIRQVPAVTKEAAISSGASPRQLLWKVELPLARPAIMLGVNQGIMMVLAMVIIGALVGGGALGYDVLVGLSQNQFGLGIAAGATIVCLGIVLDRITQAAARAEGRTHTHH